MTFLLVVLWKERALRGGHAAHSTAPPKKNLLTRSQPQPAPGRDWERGGHGLGAAAIQAHLLFSL